MSKKPRFWTLGDAAGLKAGDISDSDLRALDSSAMDVVFQPIVDLKKRSLFAHEVLARCQIPVYENPEHLFRTAVEQGVAGRIGRMVRDVALARVQKTPLFLNIDPAELSSRWLVRTDDPICLHEAPIFLEITEAASIDYFDLCKGALSEICSRTGAKLVIDDFGAGYSNLLRIVELEPAVVKLDRQLIVDIDKSKRKQILVRGLVRLCAELGADVVAEGIETEDEFRAVLDSGARYGQGYLLARPASPAPDFRWPT